MSEAGPNPPEDRAVPFSAGSVSQRLARVYAESLLAVAEQENQVDEIGLQFRELLLDLFPSQPELRDLLDSMAVSREDKNSIIDRIFGGKASPLFINFLKLLNDHDRLELLGAVGLELRALFDDRLGRSRIYVRSAVPLNDGQRDRIRTIMQQWLQREPLLVEIVDPEIIGGMRVVVGDELFDMSARTYLQNIRTQLLSRSSYEIQSRRDRFSAG